MGHVRWTGAGRAVVLVALVTTATACSTLQPRHQRSVGYDVAAAGVRTVAVDSSTGSVTIVPGGSAIGVTEHWVYRGAAPRTSHVAAGGTLTLRSTCRDCQVDYTVRMPVADALRVDLGTGRVRLTGLTGAVTVSDETGDVTASGLGSSEAVLTTETGNVSAGFETAPETLRAGTATGDVRLTVPGGSTYAVDAHSDTGSVHVSVPRGEGGRHVLTARSETGDVSVVTG